MTPSNDHQFDVQFYRLQNRDLNDLGMSDRQLKEHFKASGCNETRPYAPTAEAAETMSMKWLRGRGIEVGAGKRPTRTFGNTTLEFGEIDQDFAFGGSEAHHWIDIGGNAPENLRGVFDFCICSHVLEHCDSLLRGVVNALDTVRDDGLAYLVLPDKRYLGDKHFIDDFDIEHHLEEYEDPLKYSDIHDSAYIQFAPVEEYVNEHAVLASEYRNQIKNGTIEQQYRFMHHKHNYSFGNWVKIMSGLQEHTKYFEIEDAYFGRDRLDCHFVLRKTAAHQPSPTLVEQ